MARAKRRWLPALLIPLVLMAAILVASIQAGAAPSLPAKSAQDILGMIANTNVRALSGTLSQEANLGLPDLSGTGPSTGPDAATALEFLTGNHTARIYLDAPANARLQIMDRMAERDIVVNGSDLWYYNSADNSAVHTALPPRPGNGSTETTPSEGIRHQVPTPEALASRFLAAVDPSTEVAVGQASTVAGRSAYTLTLTPRSQGTLVDSVAVSVDSETGLPLGVAVRAKGQTEPAYSLAFSELNLSAPDPSLFTFTPPAGSKVTEKAPPAPDAVQSSPVPHARPAVTGKGWDTIVALPAGSAPTQLMANPQFAQALQPAAGGRALTTSLLSVLVLSDGRVLAGMVPLDRLESAAAAG